MATVGNKYFTPKLIIFIAILVTVGILAASYTITPAFATTQKNVTEKINVSCTTAIAVPDDTIDVGTGYIPQSCIDCWIGQNTSSCVNVTTSFYNVTNATATLNTHYFTDDCWINTTDSPRPDYIKIENKGNDYLNMTLELLDDAGWNNQSGGDEFGNNSVSVYVVQGASIDSIYGDDTNKSCLSDILGPPNATILSVGGSVTLCGAMAWEGYRNELFLFDKFNINPKTDPKQYNFIKQLTVVPAVACGETVADPAITDMLIASTQTAKTGIKADSAMWTTTGTITDGSTSLSNFYSISGIYAASGSLEPYDFAITGTGFGTADYDTGAGCSATTHCGRIVDTDAGTFTISNFAGLGISSTSDLDMSNSPGSLGGAAITNTQNGNRMYLLAAKQGISTVTEGALYRGTFGFPDYTFTSTAIDNLCTDFSACAGDQYPSAITDAHLADNGPTYNDLFYVSFSDNTGADYLGAWADKGRAAPNAGDAVTSLVTIPGLAATSILRDIEFVPNEGKLLAWVDVQSGGTYGSSTNDYIGSWIIVRQGNSNPIVSIIQTGNFPTSPTTAQQAAGVGVKPLPVNPPSTGGSAELDWPTLGQNAQHIGKINLSAASTNSTVWSVSTGGGTPAALAAADGKVFVSILAGGTINAYNATNGTIIWSSGLSTSVAGVTIYGGRVYLSSDTDGDLYALNETNGSTIWTFVAPESNSGSVPAVSDGIAVYQPNGGGSSYIRAVNATNGSEIWSFSIGNSQATTPAIYNGIVYAVTSINFYALNLSNGAQIWNNTGGGSDSYSPLISNNVIYYATQIGSSEVVRALNASNGSQIWNKTIASAIYSTAPRVTPAIENGVLYVTVTNGNLTAINATTGATIWDFSNTSRIIQSSPIITNNFILYGDRNPAATSGIVYAVNKTTGAVAWTRDMASFIPFPGAAIRYLGLDLVFFGTGAGDTKVYAFGSALNLTNVDLLPLEMNLTPASPIAGDNVTINVTIKNNGSTGAGSFNTSFLVDDVEQNRQETVNLDFGASEILTFYWTAVTGMHNLTAAVDIDNAVNETNETNNNITKTVNIGVACNLTVLIDGVEASNFTNAGEPYNVTVNVTSFGSPAGATVRVIENNGYTFFAFPQFQDSNVSNYVSGEVFTGSDGIESLTVVPTGGRNVDTSKVGNYTIDVRAIFSGSNCANKTLTVTNVDFPDPSTSISIPNRAQIDSFKTETLRIYDKVKGWLELGGGEQKNVNITDGDSDKTLFDAIAAKPFAVNLTVYNSTNDPVPNAEVTFTERNGYPPFVLPQTADSNVSNSAVGTVRTDSNGIAKITIIPTGGRNINEAILGAYNITVEVKYSNGTLLGTGIVNVTNRDFTEPSGAQQSIFNQGNIDSFKTEILRIYDRIKGWLAA